MRLFCTDYVIKSGKPFTVWGTGTITKEVPVNWPVLVLILALLLAIAWLMRKRAETATSGRKTSLHRKDDAKEYRGVTIESSKNACSAAADLSGRRFLATAAPPLPLPGCDAAECNCRFVQHQDRRQGSDRRNPFSPGVIGNSASQSDLRDGTDRRNGDDP